MKYTVILLEPPHGKTNNLHMRKKKDADQLRGNREADQRLCLRYTDSRLPLLFKYEISSFQLTSVTVQSDLCRTCSETTLLVFPRGGLLIDYIVRQIGHCIGGNFNIHIWAW